MASVSDIERVRAGGDQVSELTTARLSVYLRCLDALEARGVNTVSSQGLATQFQLNAAQIRKDLAHFGEFGIRGVGYYVTELQSHLRAILGLDRTVRVAVLGAGNLGLALADYPGFRQEGFSIVALFDADKAKVGRRSKGGVRIHDVSGFPDFVRDEHVDIVVIAVPVEAGQQVVDMAVEAGVRAVLNFASGTLRVPPGVKLKNVDLTVSMESLSFFLARGDADGKTP